MLSTPRMEEVTARWEAWWRGDASEPLVSITYPHAGAELQSVAKPWMSPLIVREWTLWRQEFVFGQAVEEIWKGAPESYLDDAITLLKHYASVTGHAGVAYPFLLPGLGPGVVAAFVSDFTQFHGDTIWFEPKEAMELEEIITRAHAFDPAHPTPGSYAAIAIPAAVRAIEALHEHFVMAMPDLGCALDILSSLRHSENLMFDMIDEPELVDEAVEALDQAYRRTQRHFQQFLTPANGNRSAECMRYLSDGPTRVALCDAAALISPAFFERWGLPAVERDVASFPGKVIYHLDGPGQIPHLENLLKLDGLTGIQWVQGAGNPESLDPVWDDLYRQILDAGKLICLCSVGTDPEPLKAFFRRFPAGSFFAPTVLSSEAEAHRFLDVLGVEN